MVFQRKNIRLAAPRYFGLQCYFLTMCTQNRVARFGDPGLVGDLLRLLKESAEVHRFAVSAYCFMPDHLHFLTHGTEENSDLTAFANVFKQRSGYAFQRTSGQRLWQKKYYDHILRGNEQWERVAWYIWMNPVRKGLCGRPEEWSFSGSFTVDWRGLLPANEWIPPWKKAGQ